MFLDMGLVRSSVWLGSIVIKRPEGSLVSLKDKEIVKLYSHFCHNKSIPMFPKKKTTNQTKSSTRRWYQWEGGVLFDLPSPRH